MATYNPDGSAVSLDATSIDPLRGTKYDFPRENIGYGRKSLDPHIQNGDAQSESRLWEQSGNKPAQVGARSLNPESDYDYGSRVGVWRLLDCFEQYQMPVTAFAVGQAFENPEVASAFTQFL
ncbi:hypothetical protein SBRCBS47491_009720 [Sporothrix bragantina]|uniref:NodB homology domain-containing protein n=1 Tax=Sporothrix bragantina TaxID=671064 RepID=A0ABP0CWY9_9PEZI